MVLLDTHTSTDNELFELLEGDEHSKSKFYIACWDKKGENLWYEPFSSKQSAQESFEKYKIGKT